MARIRHLDNAPITEAIIDFRVKLAPSFDPARFSGLAERLQETYPRHEQRKLFKQELGVKNGRPLSIGPKDLGFHGYWFKSADEKKIAQFRVDGFTFNKLRPYTSWAEVIEEARQLWDLYVEVASPEVVTRIAVRYINHLKIPAPVKDPSEYFRAPIPIPVDLPLALNNYLTRVVVRDRESDVAVNISHALTEVVDSKHLTFLLDIDAYKARDFEPTDHVIWETFEALHDSKNRIFFGSITEETARLYE